MDYETLNQGDEELDDDKIDGGEDLDSEEEEEEDDLGLESPDE